MMENIGCMSEEHGRLTSPRWRLGSLSPIWASSTGISSRQLVVRGHLKPLRAEQEGGGQFVLSSCEVERGARSGNVPLNLNLTPIGAGWTDWIGR